MSRLIKLLVFAVAGLFALVPLIAVFALVGLPVLLVLAIIAIPVAIVLAVLGSPLLLLVLAGMAVGALVLGMFFVLAAVAFAILKVTLLVVLPLVVVGWIVMRLLGATRCRRMRDYV